MSSVAGNFRCYFPQSFPLHESGKPSLMPLTEELQILSASKYKTLLFFSPWRAIHLFRLSVPLMSQRIIDMAAEMSVMRKWRAIHQVYHSQLSFAKKNVPVSFTNSMAAALPAGQKGAKACWIARPLFRVSHQLKTRTQSWCTASGSVGLSLFTVQRVWPVWSRV